MISRIGREFGANLQVNESREEKEETEIKKAEMIKMRIFKNYKNNNSDGTINKTDLSFYYIEISF